ncbi:MAG: DUF502 domain-containing protein [Dehalococcoidia bacterium]|nr:MAG: DUF502 domain-containing protein [Dehalococcoidia bacterium]
MYTPETGGSRPNPFLRGLNRATQSEYWLRILSRMRSHLLAGILVVVPLLATVLILKWLFDWVDELLQPIIRGFAGRPMYGLGFVITLLIVYVAGVITTYFGGQRLLRFVESLIARVPIVRPMYNGIKQVLESFAAPRETGFMQVVLLEFPRKGMRSIGFITNEEYDASGQKLLNVFVPTSPNPTSGFLQIVREEDILRTDISVDDALKMVVSAGRISINRVNKSISRNQNEAAVRKAAAPPSSDDTG